MIIRLYFIMRLPFVLVLKAVFGIRQPAPADIGRILVIRLDRIGDFVTSLPVIDNLKAAYPRARLDVLVRPQIKGLAKLCKNIDGITEYGGFFSAVSKVRKERYDLAIDLLYDYKIMPAILAFLSGAPVRAGFAWGFRELLFNRAVKQEDTAGKSMTAVHLEVLKLLDVQARVTAAHIDIEKKKPGGQLVIGIHPAGHFPSQAWDKDRFAAVARWAVQQYHAMIYVFAGPGEKETVSYIVSAAGDKDVHAVFPDIEGLVRLIAQCDLVLCNNSGPLHVAAALDIPTVSTMGPTDPVLWRPESPRAVVINKHCSCSPCSRAVCRPHECMKSISVEEFEKAVHVQIHRIQEKNRTVA